MSIKGIFCIFFCMFKSEIKPGSDRCDVNLKKFFMLQFVGVSFLSRLDLKTVNSLEHLARV